MPAGCIFADKGPGIFVPGDSNDALLGLAALTNSMPFGYLVSVQLARTELAQSFEVGLIARTPVPHLSPADVATLAGLARHAWSLRRRMDTRTETSYSFVLPALLQVDGERLDVRARAWAEHVEAAEVELEAIQAKIDERCFALYGIGEVDRRVITEGFGAKTGNFEIAEEDATEDDSDDDNADTAADRATLATELVSWAAGVAFGRFDVRLATGDRPQPSEPEPFDPLPICSHGMLTGDDGLLLARPPAGYPLAVPIDGVLVDDPGHPRDLTAAVRAVFEVVFGSRTDGFWQEVAALLDPRDHDLRWWLASGFFEHHLRRHSKSRRKAPILWQLSIPSGRYSVWCYAHRMTRDSLLAVQNDIVGPKLATEGRRLLSIVTQAGQTPSPRERTEIAVQEAFVDELRTMLDNLRRVAPLWNPDLDDGVVIVMAPLWRLIPTHKAWQKELHAKWDELAAGKYDWAHLAMHIWPERVVPKCVADRSLAIAHGLEKVLWVEGADSKWSVRQKPTRPIDELVAERTSPAVKDALTMILETLSQVHGGTRRGKSLVAG